MKVLSYSIAQGVFEKYPGYCRGVVLGFDLHNTPSPPGLIQLLRESEASVRQNACLETLAEHPRIKPWREAYKAFGAKPSEFRSSVEAMARRALRNDQLPSINALVDIGNIISLKHLLPVGGHSMDQLTQNIALRFASGQEDFVPFGSNEVEHPLPGEVIFAEGNTVLTRRWTWRQANHTITLPETRSIEINIDRLPPVDMEEIHAIAAQVMQLVQQYCGGELRYEIMSLEHQEMTLTPYHQLHSPESKMAEK